MKPKLRVGQVWSLGGHTIKILSVGEHLVRFIYLRHPMERAGRVVTGALSAVEEWCDAAVCEKDPDGTTLARAMSEVLL